MSEMILIAASGAEKADVATWLLATADSKGISRKLILTRNAGFLAPAELFDGLPYTLESVDEEKKIVTVSVAFDDRPVPLPDLVEPDREAVRAWAKKQPDLDVADKGRVAKAVYDAYKLAHS